MLPRRLGGEHDPKRCLAPQRTKPLLLLRPTLFIEPDEHQRHDRERDHEQHQNAGGDVQWERRHWSLKNQSGIDSRAQRLAYAPHRLNLR